MALDILRIAQILECDRILLREHAEAYASDIDADAETSVAKLITRWETNNLDTAFTRVSPNIRNFGAGKNPDDLRGQIRRQLASDLVLHRATWYRPAGTSEVWLERG